MFLILRRLPLCVFILSRPVASHRSYSSRSQSQLRWWKIHAKPHIFNRASALLIPCCCWSNRLTNEDDELWERWSFPVQYFFDEAGTVPSTENEHNFSSVLKSSNIFWFLSCWLFGNGAQKQPNAATPGSCVADLTDGTMMDDLDNNMWAVWRQLIVYLLLLKMESLAAVGVHQLELFPFLKLHSSDTDLRNMTEASSEFSLLTASF